MLGMAVFAVGFVLLLCGTAPGLYLRDAGELATAAHTLGVAHETGFSLYTLLGKALALLPLGEVAFRVALLSALGGAAAAALLYRLTRELAGDRPEAAPAGVAAAAILLSGFGFYRSATIVEVYAPTTAGLALGLWLLVRANRGERGAALCLALLGGLSLGLHGQLRLLLGPPCLVWALWRLRRGDRWPLLAPAAVMLGAIVVAYLPIRAARDPAANWGDPRTLGLVLDHLSAARIRRAFAAEMFPPASAFWHHLRVYAGQLESQLAIPALLAAAAGAGVALRDKRLRFVGAVLLFVLAGDALYSAGLNPMGLEDLQCGAPSQLALAALAGIALFAAARKLGRAAPFAAGALGVVACVPALLSDLPAKRGLHYEASAWTGAALAAAPPRALLLVTSDDLAAGTLYEQAVAAARPDVTVLVRQQLWEAPLLRKRLVRAGGEVRDPLAGASEAERLRREDDHARLIVEAELPRRAVLWEPGTDPPPAPAELDVPLFRLAAAPPPAPQVRALASKIDGLLQPGRDPFVQRLAASSLVGLSRPLILDGDLERSAALLEAALALHAGDGAAATNLAVVRARRGDLNGALALVDEVLRRDPERLTARLNSGRYRLQLGDLDGASAQFRRVLARRPDPAALAGLARVALRKNDRAEAARLVTEAARLAPRDPDVRVVQEELRK